MYTFFGSIDSNILIPNPFLGTLPLKVIYWIHAFFDFVMKSHRKIYTQDSTLENSVSQMSIFFSVKLIFHLPKLSFKGFLQSRPNSPWFISIQSKGIGL